MFTYYSFFVDRNAMVSLNFFNQNSFSRFLDILKKPSKKKKTRFPSTITIILDHTLYGKVKKKILEFLASDIPIHKFRKSKKRVFK